MRLPNWHDVTELEPAWYAAAAAVAGAGVALFPGRRILAGAIGGIAVLAIGLMRKQGGCSCSGTATAPAPNPNGLGASTTTAPLDFNTIFEGGGNMAVMPRAGGCS